MGRWVGRRPSGGLGAGRGQGQGESTSLGSGSARVFSLGKKQKQGAHSILESEADMWEMPAQAWHTVPVALAPGPRTAPAPGPSPPSHRKNVCRKECVSSQYSRSEVVLTFFERSPLDQVLKNDNVHKIQPSFQSPVKISGETRRGGAGCVGGQRWRGRPRGPETFPAHCPRAGHACPPWGPESRPDRRTEAEGGTASRSCETVCFSLLACGLHAACFQRCINWNLLKKTSL